MIKSVSINKKTVQLIQSLQSALNNAQSQLDAAVAGVLASLDVQGKVVAIDAEKLELSIEVEE